MEQVEQVEQVEQKQKTYVAASKIKQMFNALKRKDLEVTVTETASGSQEKQTPKALSSSVANWLSQHVDDKLKELFRTYEFTQDGSKLKPAQLFEQHVKQLVSESVYDHLPACDEDQKEFKFIEQASQKCLHDHSEQLGGSSKIKKNSEGAVVLNAIKFATNKYVLFLITDLLFKYEYLCNVSGKGSIRSPPPRLTFDDLFSPKFDYSGQI